VPIVVPGTDVRLPSYGYGCAALMARTTRAESVRLLEAAFDAGVTHFDVARSYGYGEAESAVGDLLARHRDAVTVTTKLGIAPPRRTAGLRAARTVARRLAAGSARLRPLLRAGASRMVSSGRFSVEEARASVERSLRELRTDAVDVLLLHDCEPGELHDDLLEFLHGLVQAGDVRAFGVATGRDAAREIVADRPAFAPLVQVPDPLLGPPPVGLGPAVVTHSVLAQGHGRVRESLGRASIAVDVDVSDPAQLGRLLLALALRRNGNGTVLWSSRDVAHIRANAGLLHSPLPAEALDPLERVLATPTIGGRTSG
jgi:aryl-alcohol dehydrogenase-like predicted oxidoreductase